jgi:hypothetical protein
MKAATETPAASFDGSGRMMTDAPSASAANHSGRSTQNKASAAKPKRALPSKRRKATQRPSRSASTAEKLVCRYCGSDDLAPSFKKRRDARCRSCFKQRYGSAGRAMTNQGARTRKAKAAK